MEPGRELPSGGNLIPVIYKLDMCEASSFFVASAFAMKDKDIVYVSNAPTDPVQKFLSLVGTVTAPAISAAGVYGTMKP